MRCSTVLLIIRHGQHSCIQNEIIVTYCFLAVLFPSVFRNWQLWKTLYKQVDGIPNAGSTDCKMSSARYLVLWLGLQHIGYDAIEARIQHSVNLVVTAVFCSFKRLDCFRAKSVCLASVMGWTWSKLKSLKINAEWLQSVLILDILVVSNKNIYCCNL